MNLQVGYVSLRETSLFSLSCESERHISSGLLNEKANLSKYSVKTQNIFLSMFTLMMDLHVYSLYSWDVPSLECFSNEDR